MNLINERQLLNAVLRRDFATFARRSFSQLNPGTRYLDNWHIQVAADALEQCETGRTNRLIINIPPRYLKSHLATIAFPAYLLGRNPSAQIITASYAQPLADRMAAECRSLMQANWYRDMFPATVLAPNRQSISDYMTTRGGFRLSTSVGGVLTGRGADFIIIDDPLKPEEALSEAQRTRVNEWFDHTLISRLNNKRTGCIILIMQRLHEDDLVGHVREHGDWKVLSIPAIAEQDETYVIENIMGKRVFMRRCGEALHPEREPLEELHRIRDRQGEYHFYGQYQQSPAPLGGGMVKTCWFQPTPADEQPRSFELILQSWDTANKTTDLSDFSVCTTWGVVKDHLYLIDVLRRRLEFPDLRRTVKEHAAIFKAQNIIIEDKASGTQLIQELVADGIHQATRYQTSMDKVMRMYSVTCTLGNGFVHIPDRAPWLAEYLHEMARFPNGRYDDQVDSTSQALDWFKNERSSYSLFEFYREQAAEYEASQTAHKSADVPTRCEKCGNANLDHFLVQGISGDIQTSCNCGWAKIIPCPQKTQTPVKIEIPTFEK